MITNQNELILTPPPEVSDHIDLAGFPEWFRNYINAVCLAGRCTVPEFAIMAAFQAVGAIVGNSARVKYGDYENPPMLWGAIMARSGFGKSKQHQIIMDPLLKIDGDLNDKYRAEKQKYDAEVNSRKKTVNNSFINRPRKQTLIIKDATPEARAARLQDSPNGCILYMDELAGLFQRMGMYNGSGSGEISELIDIYENDLLKADRKNEEASIYVKKPFLSIYGTMQPKVARDIFKNENLWNQGFAQRWLFVYVTDSSGLKPEPKKLDQKQVSEWCEFVTGLRKRYFGNDGKVSLSDKARDIFKKFCRWTEGFSAQKWDDNKTAIYEKSHANVLRLSLIIQIIKNKEAEHVTGETMQTAVNCMYYFLANAVRFYDDLFPEKPESSGAAKPTKKDAVLVMWESGKRDANFMAMALSCDRTRIYQILNELEKENKISRPCKQGETPKISTVLKSGSK